MKKTDLMKTLKKNGADSILWCWNDEQKEALARYITEAKTTSAYATVTDVENFLKKHDHIHWDKSMTEDHLNRMSHGIVLTPEEAGRLCDERTFTLNGHKVHFYGRENDPDEDYGFLMTCCDGNDFLFWGGVGVCVDGKNYWVTVDKNAEVFVKLKSHFVTLHNGEEHEIIDEYIRIRLWKNLSYIDEQETPETITETEQETIETADETFEMTEDVAIETEPETIDETFDANDSEMTDDYDKMLKDAYDKWAEDYDRRCEKEKKMQTQDYIKMIEGYDWTGNCADAYDVTQDDVDEALTMMTRDEMTAWLQDCYAANDVNRSLWYCEVMTRDPRWIVRRAVWAALHIFKRPLNDKMIAAVIYEYADDVCKYIKVEE